MHEFWRWYCVQSGIAALCGSDYSKLCIVHFGTKVRNKKNAKWLYFWDLKEVKDFWEV